jgi:acetyl-CoA acetyltransferase family protein
VQPECPDLTAGNSAQVSDGAAAVLIASESKAAALGLVPRARFVGFSVAACDPVVMLQGPIPATKKILDRTSMSVDDFDVLECNEAMGSIVPMWAREFDVDMERVNPNGSGISLGHPVGASGARIMVTLLHELERTGGRFGFQTMCEGGGQGNATIIERLG